MILNRYAQYEYDMKKIKPIYLLGFLIIAFSCKQNKAEYDNTNKEGIKKEDEKINIIAQQRPFGDLIEFEMEVKKTIDKLELTNPDNVQIDSTDLVIGMAIGKSQIAIPLSQLSAFEVANFSNGANNFSLTWCPIVGTARVFESDSTNSGFDIGWGLNNNNLLLVDRKTKTVWNQLSGEAIHGKLKGEHLSPIPTIQTTWGFWKQKNPQTKLLTIKDTTNAIFPESVNESPHYNNWKPGDGRPETKNVHETETLGLGIEISNSSMYFPFEAIFKEKSPLTYELNGENITVFFDKSGLTAWVENSKGEMIPSIIAYNWAWKNFYPNTKIYKK